MSRAVAREEAERLLFLEARLLDEGRFAEWLALFTDDAWYWVPLGPDQGGWEEAVSIVYDDRALLETRVRRLCEAQAHALSPRIRTARVIGNLQLEPAEPGCDGVAASSFVLVEHRPPRKTLHGGRLRHGLRRDGDALRIAWKRVDLVDSDGVLDSITIPF